MSSRLPQTIASALLARAVLRRDAHVVRLSVHDVLVGENHLLVVHHLVCLVQPRLIIRVLLRLRLALVLRRQLLLLRLQRLRPTSPSPPTFSLASMSGS